MRYESRIQLEAQTKTQILDYVDEVHKKISQFVASLDLEHPLDQSTYDYFMKEEEE